MLYSTNEVIITIHSNGQGIICVFNVYRLNSEFLKFVTIFIDAVFQKAMYEK